MSDEIQCIHNFGNNCLYCKIKAAIDENPSQIKQKLLDPATSDEEHQQIIRKFIKKEFQISLPPDINIRIIPKEVAIRDTNVHYIEIDPIQEDKPMQGGSRW